jgi:CRAL/TRIO domain
MSLNNTYIPLVEMSTTPQSPDSTLDSTTDLLAQVNKFKEDYYAKNNKNVFFKKTQKADCAEKVAQQFDINILLANTVYIIGDTNHILFDYTVFKTYANESNYSQIVNYVLFMFDTVIRKHGSYVTHVNLDTFTVSAAERYKKVIQVFNTECINKTEFQYTKCLKSWYVYNPPSVIDMVNKILKPFIEPSVFNNVTIVSKADSPVILARLLGK